MEKFLPCSHQYLSSCLNPPKGPILPLPLSNDFTASMCSNMLSWAEDSLELLSSRRAVCSNSEVLDNLSQGHSSRSTAEPFSRAYLSNRSRQPQAR